MAFVPNTASKESSPLFFIHDMFTRRFATGDNEAGLVIIAYLAKFNGVDVYSEGNFALARLTLVLTSGFYNPQILQVLARADAAVQSYYYYPVNMPTTTAQYAYYYPVSPPHQPLPSTHLPFTHSGFYNPQTLQVRARAEQMPMATYTCLLNGFYNPQTLQVRARAEQMPMATDTCLLKCDFALLEWYMYIAPPESEDYKAAKGVLDQIRPLSRDVLGGYTSYLFAKAGSTGSSGPRKPVPNPPRPPSPRPPWPPHPPMPPALPVCTVDVLLNRQAVSFTVDDCTNLVDRANKLLTKNVKNVGNDDDIYPSAFTQTAAIGLPLQAVGTAAEPFYCHVASRNSLTVRGRFKNAVQEANVMFNFIQVERKLPLTYSECDGLAQTVSGILYIEVVKSGNPQGGNFGRFSCSGFGGSSTSISTSLYDSNSERMYTTAFKNTKSTFAAIAKTYGLECGDSIVARPGCDISLTYGFDWMTSNFFQPACGTPNIPPPPPPLLNQGCPVSILLIRNSGGLAEAMCRAFATQLNALFDLTANMGDEALPIGQGPPVYPPPPGVLPPAELKCIETLSTDSISVVQATFLNMIDQSIFLIKFGQATGALAALAQNIGLGCDDSIEALAGCGLYLSVEFNENTPGFLPFCRAG
eukprot:gene17949-24352_t